MLKREKTLAAKWCHDGKGRVSLGMKCCQRNGGEFPYDMMVKVGIDAFPSERTNNGKGREIRVFRTIPCVSKAGTRAFQKQVEVLRIGGIYD